MILIDENTGEARYVVVKGQSIMSTSPLGRLTLAEVRAIAETAGHRPPIDGDALKHETLVRKMAARLPHRDIRTIRKYLRGEPVRGETILAELEDAKASVDREAAER